MSCEPEDWLLDVDCDNDCFGFRPDSASLIVYVTLNAENDSVPLTFYRGDINGEIDWQDTATASNVSNGEEFFLLSRIGTTYTVEATYRSGERTIIAIDSDDMSVSDYGEDCGDPCYVVRGGILDLRLRE
jgi:hypothetical protein